MEGAELSQKEKKSFKKGGDFRMTWLDEIWSVILTLVLFEEWTIALDASWYHIKCKCLFLVLLAWINNKPMLSFIDDMVRSYLKMIRSPHTVLSLYNYNIPIVNKGCASNMLVNACFYKYWSNETCSRRQENSICMQKRNSSWSSNFKCIDGTNSPF